MTDINLGDNGLKVFKAFVRELAKTIKDEEFDIVLAAGDSGAVMVEFTKIVFEQLGQKTPPMVLLPVYRYSNATDKDLSSQEKNLEKEAAKQFKGHQVNKILFVDDEIGSGDTLSASLKAIMTVSKSDKVDCTVLAESDTFDEKVNIPDVKINFRAFSEHKGIYNAIFWFIPTEYEQPVQEVLTILYPNLDADKWPMNILLGAPVKQIVNGEPSWSYEIEDRVKAKLTNLPELQKQFRTYVEKLAAETLKTL